MKKELTSYAQVTAKDPTLCYSNLPHWTGKFNRRNRQEVCCDSTTSLHNNVSALFDYRWEKSMTVVEFVVGFHTMWDKINKLQLNHELKGHLFLSQANLDAHDRNIIIGSSCGDYSLQALSTSLRNA